MITQTVGEGSLEDRLKIDQLEAKVRRLTAERDEARRELIEMASECGCLEFKGAPRFAAAERWGQDVADHLYPKEVMP